MTSQHDKAKRWRPWQFSLAVLFLVVTIAALFSAIWLHKPSRITWPIYDPEIEAPEEDTERYERFKEQLVP